MAKYGMSQCALGMAEEFREDGVAVNTLWPRTGNILHHAGEQSQGCLIKHFNSMLGPKLCVQ